ncbi:MAG: CRISPR-associated endoribonuclease Cas6 [Epsilonproteobacteria bacterium]|nr:CRISPR-associated endoribonuclease Cas6 [Campylobacterota bacterium]
MRYFELKCKAYLKRDLNYQDIFDVISKYINFSISIKGGILERFHKSRGLKYYTFSGFTPIEKDKIYKKKKVYEFKIRSLDRDFIYLLAEKLKQNVNNPNMVVVDVDYKEVEEFFIKKLYSLTPVIVTTKEKVYWTIQKDGDILNLIRQLHNNLEKKYNTFFNKDIKAKENFIELIEIKNRVPFTIEFIKNNKRIKLFGNKFEITPKSDELSQKLAFVALGAGLGEKGSFGGGFCVGK